MILECKNVCKSYTQGKLTFPVLFDINFSLDEGEYVAIMGPSGSGKSTLMNILGCLDVPTSGQVVLDGRDIGTCTDNELADIRLAKVGFVFQNYQLLGSSTALQNVELPLTYAGVPRQQRREIAAQALSRVGLSDKLNALPNQLSGGQKQRVAIARAIVNRPRLLLADEPTGALDSKSGAQVMELFRELNADGMTLLMITHDAQVAANARRICEIKDGRLHESADAAAQAAVFSRSVSAPEEAAAKAEKQGPEDVRSAAALKTEPAAEPKNQAMAASERGEEETAAHE